METGHGLKWKGLLWGMHCYQCTCGREAIASTTKDARSRHAAHMAEVRQRRARERFRARVEDQLRRKKA